MSDDSNTAIRVAQAMAVLMGGGGLLGKATKGTWVPLFAGGLTGVTYLYVAWLLRQGEGCALGTFISCVVGTAFLVRFHAGRKAMALVLALTGYAAAATIYHVGALAPKK